VRERRGGGGDLGRDGGAGEKVWWLQGEGTGTGTMCDSALYDE